MSLPESNIDWVDHLEIDGVNVPLRNKMPASYESMDESLMDSPLDQTLPTSFTSGLNQSVGMKPQEPNIDLELDVKVLRWNL